MYEYCSSVVCFWIVMGQKNGYLGERLYELMYQWDAWLIACGGPFSILALCPAFEQLLLQSEIN
jgi:hypothetical protein